MTIGIENLDKIMHFHFNFDACPVHSPFVFVYLTHQNLSTLALFCLNSLAKVNMQSLIYEYCMNKQLVTNSVCGVDKNLENLEDKGCEGNVYDVHWESFPP